MLARGSVRRSVWGRPVETMGLSGYRSDLRRAEKSLVPDRLEICSPVRGKLYMPLPAAPVEPSEGVIWI